MSSRFTWQPDYSKKLEGDKMAGKKEEENKKVVQEEKEEETKKAAQEEKETELTYAQILEARAQRGSMTHQKNFAVKQAKKKEMEGK